MDFSATEITSKKVRGVNVDFLTIKISSKKVLGNDVIFWSAKLHRKSTWKWRVDSSKLALRRIDIIFTSNRRQFDVEFSLVFLIMVAAWKPETFQKQQQKCSRKKICKFHRKSLVLESLFNKVAVMGPATLFKKTPTQTLSCEIRNLKSMYECLLLNFILKRDSNILIFLWVLWIIQNTYFADDLQTAGSETPVRGLTSIKLQISLQ